MIENNKNIFFNLKSLNNLNIKKHKIIIITGATGSGKSAYAVKLAQEINGVIINADSMQIYRQIPILSAQPTITERAGVQHYLYGFCDIFDTKTNYSVGRYLLDLKRIVEIIMNSEKNIIPIIVGGTMLYIDAIVNGLNVMPEIPIEVKSAIRKQYADFTTEELYNELLKIDDVYAKIIDKNNPQRILRGIEVKVATGKSLSEFWAKRRCLLTFDNNEYALQKLIITLPREILYDRINKRFDKMIGGGALEEARTIYDYCHRNEFLLCNLPKAIGLHNFFDYFNKKISLDYAIELSKQESRNYAKRQLTWFRNRFSDFTQIEL